MRFIRKDYPTVMSGWVVRYENDGPNPFHNGEVNASRDGVSIDGIFPIMGKEGVDNLIEAIQRAQIHAEHLAQNNNTIYNQVDPLDEDRVKFLVQYRREHGEDDNGNLTP